MGDEAPFDAILCDLSSKRIDLAQPEESRLTEKRTLRLVERQNAMAEGALIKRVRQITTPP
jgi:hypothetical protein